MVHGIPFKILNNQIKLMVGSLKAHLALLTLLSGNANSSDTYTTIADEIIGKYDVKNLTSWLTDLEFIPS